MATAAGIPTRLTARSRVSLELEAFTEFPYALFVLNPDGAVVCHNREATRLIEVAGMKAQALTCCELLGCRRPDTVLEGECVTELALSRNSPCRRFAWTCVAQAAPARCGWRLQQSAHRAREWFCSCAPA